MQQFHIIDTLGPFMVHTNHKTINWSKVNFSTLETNNRLPTAVRRQIIERFTSYTRKIASLGYDSVSIDDLAHLISFPFYDQELRQLLGDYHQLYGELFAIAKERRLKIFVNTDYLFFNDQIDKHLKHSRITPITFFTGALDALFQDFPDIDGVILRIGENDGKDVSDRFLSRLTLKTPANTRKMLTKVLPLFEKNKKTLVFRTWTVGVHKVGDLIWNESTYDKVFASIKSDSLVISMKFGDTDFMRYLQLNPLFTRGTHKKIIELQTRREWEGMGEFPSFVGWEYQKYLTQLSSNQNVVGIHAWCQTGGWAKRTWNSITYFDKTAFWNELNTEVTIAIAKQGISVEDAVKQFCKSRGISDTDSFLELLRLADTAILKGIYIPTAAQKPLYFRRTRIPPLTWLTWDIVHLPPIVVYLHKLLVPSPEVAISDADEALRSSKKMVEIAKRINLDRYIIDSLLFEQATLAIFAQLRRYIFDMLSTDEIKLLNDSIHAYTQDFPQHYTIHPLSPYKATRTPPRRLFTTFVRDIVDYRKRDKLLLKTSFIQARIVRMYLRRSRSHLADQSMGFEVFFK